jgi:pimeloyl-ACP methyl ester carboxylesterase
MLVKGARPRRVVLSGMGYEGIVSTGRRVDFFRRVLTQPDAFERGSAEWMAQAFLKTTGGDAAALVHILDTFVDTPADFLPTVTQPVLVVAGDQDFDNGAADRLADAFPNARHVVTPGNHMSAVLKPDLGVAIANFLAA